MEKKMKSHSQPRLREEPGRQPPPEKKEGSPQHLVSRPPEMDTRLPSCWGQLARNHTAPGLTPGLWEEGQGCRWPARTQA